MAKMGSSLSKILFSMFSLELVHTVDQFIKIAVSISYFMSTTLLIYENNKLANRKMQTIRNDQPMIKHQILLEGKVC